MAGSAMLLMAPAVEAAVLQSKTYEYDAEGRMTKEIDADNHATVYTYDGNGNRLTRTDALNHTTTYAYDELNRLKSVTDPATGVTQYSYDARDNLVTVTDPRGLSTTYTYNGFDQLTAQSSPDTGSASFTPNKAGQVTARTNAASQQTQYVYDALGRVTQATYADGRVVTSTYDQGTNGKGRLTSIADSESTISWTYDADGHVLTRTQTIGSGTGAQTSVISYQYNSAGQLTQMTTPGGSALTYTYDDQGRVQSLSRNGSSIVGSVQYRPFGGITSLTWGNGQIDTRTYDQNGRLDLVTVGTTVHDMGYDAVSRITAIQDMADNTRNKTFSYDTLDRLTGYTGQNSTRSWSYDGVGNRTQQTIGSTTETYVYASASNRLNSLTNSANSTQNRSYQYTTTGHTSTDGVNNYTYDARERLVSATTPTASASYTINPLGQRIKKSVTQSGTTTVTGFIYDDAGHLIAETDGAGVITSEHYWLGDMPVAVNKGPQLVWATDFSTTPTTSNPNPTGFSFPSGNQDVNQLISWENGGQIAVRTKAGSTASSASMYAQRVEAAEQTISYSFEITATTQDGSRYALVSLANSSSGPGQRGLYIGFVGGGVRVYRRDDSLVNGVQVEISDLLTTVTVGTTYVFNIISSATDSDVTMYAKGSSPSSAIHRNYPMTWNGGGTGVTKRLRIYGASGYSYASGNNVSYIDNFSYALGAGTTLYYVHPDHLNTPRQITTSDVANTVVWRWDSEPFGSTLPDQDPDQNSQVLSYNLRFPGQYFDGETQLNYNYFRDYSSVTGRYVQSDPIGLYGGLNTYVYAHDAPIRHTDSLGLASFFDEVGVGAGGVISDGSWKGGPAAGGGIVARECCKDKQKYRQVYLEAKFGWGWGRSEHAGSGANIVLIRTKIPPCKPKRFGAGPDFSLDIQGGPEYVSIGGDGGSIGTALGGGGSVAIYMYSGWYLLYEQPMGSCCE